MEIKVAASALEYETLVLKSQPQVLGLHDWSLKPKVWLQGWSLNCQIWESKSKPQQWNLRLQGWSLNHNIGDFRLKPQPFNLRRHCQRPNLRSQTSGPKHERWTPRVRAEAWNLKSESSGLEPEPWHLKLQGWSRNPPIWEIRTRAPMLKSRVKVEASRYKSTVSVLNPERCNWNLISEAWTSTSGVQG